ncbi:MAG: IS200/IS605 family transposase [Erysipelotrichaceae bacterium]|nr:IS200/IS605 family transposase [Erysipelotrichaceae bacterium]
MGKMRKNRNGYYTNRHSCFLLQYHLVLITKYRHPVLVGELEKDLVEYTKNFFKERGLVIIEVNCDRDHIHILFEAPPQISLSEFVNAYKTGSSRTMRKNHAEFLAPYYWKPYFWSMSYFVGTVSDRSEAVVAKYIQNQKIND